MTINRLLAQGAESVVRAILDPTSVRLAVPLEARVSEEKPGFLEWRSADRPSGTADRLGRFRKGGLAKGALQRFVGLAKAPEEKIAEFARQWGVLGICEHGIPGIHEACRPGDWMRHNSEVWWLEPLDVWRGYANKFGAMLRVAANVSEGGDGSDEDWELLGYPKPELEAASSWKEVPDLKELPKWFFPVMSGIYLTADFLSGSGLEPEVSWFDRRQRFRVLISPGGVARSDAGHNDGFQWPKGSLYPVLVAQLVSAVTYGQLSECGLCTTLFDWENTETYIRKPRRDRLAYCSKECRADARKKQKAEYWRKSQGKENRR